MAKNFGPGILGSVVLIDPETGLPYKAEGGGGGSSDAFVYAGDWNGSTEYTVGQVVRITTSGNGIGGLAFALEDNVGVSPLSDPDTWKLLSNADMAFYPRANGFGSVLARNDVPYDNDDPRQLRDYYTFADGFVFSSWVGAGAYYYKGAVVRDPNEAYYVCVKAYEIPEDAEEVLDPSQDPDHWVRLTNQGGGGASNAVLSDVTDTYAYMGTAPSGSDPAVDDWNITRITLTDPNNPKHAVGPWDDRATLTYA